MTKINLDRVRAAVLSGSTTEVRAMAGQIHWEGMKPLDLTMMVIEATKKPSLSIENALVTLLRIAKEDGVPAKAIFEIHDHPFVSDDIGEGVHPVQELIEACYGEALQEYLDQKSFDPYAETATLGGSLFDWARLNGHHHMSSILEASCLHNDPDNSANSRESSCDCRL